MSKLLNAACATRKVRPCRTTMPRRISMNAQELMLDAIFSHVEGPVERIEERIKTRVGKMAHLAVEVRSSSLLVPTISQGGLRPSDVSIAV
jgi:hypothetical protein